MIAMVLVIHGAGHGPGRGVAVRLIGLLGVQGAAKRSSIQATSSS